MRSFVQVLTTPTADTPGTTLLLHFDNKRYLVGSLAEGTQRSFFEVGARLLKVSECFITGRTEWRNTGGLIGIILTLADAASSSAAASAEEQRKQAFAKGRRLGIAEDSEKMAELLEEAKKDSTRRLTLFSAPNVNYTLATARRFVFRKGTPIDVHEIQDRSPTPGGEARWEPYWADENVKVWALSVLPNPTGTVATTDRHSVNTGNPRKRSIDEVEDSDKPNVRDNAHMLASSLDPAEKDQLTLKSVVGDMFDSSWRLDTLYETLLGQVHFPATVFVRDPETHKLERYRGAIPGQPLKHGEMPPDLKKTVLVRKPWPGALVESLPATEPRKEAVSYIIRNHKQRGKFNPQRAMALKVEKGPKWARLSAGENVENADGEIITPDMVLGESKEGGGFAVIDIPEPTYIDAVLARPEWREQKVMSGVGAIVWICGAGVAGDERVRRFMEEFTSIQHVVSSADVCPNGLGMDSAAAATVRLRQIDPRRYTVPHHDHSQLNPPIALPPNARIAVRGQMIELEPKMEVHEKQAVPTLDVAKVEAETSQDVLKEALRSKEAVQAASAENQRWASSLPLGAGEAEIVTLGTGSALPSKYRNVSATLVRVPGWGSMLFDCGEGTLGQLKRVFSGEELKQILRELRMIYISHMHCDHHLGTVGVIRAWYEQVHNAEPQPANLDWRTTFTMQSGLAVVSEPAMLSWLNEYSRVEDYGFSRIAPLCITPATPSRHTTSRLGWFIPPTELAAMRSAQERINALDANMVPPSLLNLTDIQAVLVSHCQGARAVSITFPSGFKASYSGDCRPSEAFSIIGKGSTVCIHEATFDDELFMDAKAKKHSTTSEALGVAQAMGARACVLTHFSQRYQKLPVLDHGANGEEGSVTDSLPVECEDVGGDDEQEVAEMGAGGPLDDVAVTFPDQQTSDAGKQYELPTKGADGSGTARRSSAQAAVRFKLRSDMKVCVAFDYMRVKVGEIPQLEKFTPALLKLFEEEEEKPGELDSTMNGANGNGDGNGKKAKQQKKQGSRRHN